MNKVTKVNEVMEEIAVASERQTQGVDQINTTIDQLNKLTQQNASNSEQSASTAEELSNQANNIRNIVKSFRLSTSSGSLSVRSNGQLSAQMKKKQLTPVTHSINDISNNKPENIIPFDDDMGFSDQSDDDVLGDF